MRGMQFGLAAGIAAMGLAAMGFGATAQAQEKRSASAHEHGHSALDIAIEGATLAMALRAPGADIVGFEHHAESDADKAALHEAEEALGDPLALFVFPAAAGCEMVAAHVSYVTDEKVHGHDEHKDHADEHEEHSEEEEHAEHGREEGHEEGHDEEHAKDEGHAEFEAEYEMTCANPGAIDRIEFAFFERFPNAVELEINLVSEKGARQFEVERDAPVVSLDGAI